MYLYIYTLVTKVKFVFDISIKVPTFIIPHFYMQENKFGKSFSIRKQINYTFALLLNIIKYDILILNRSLNSKTIIC